MKKHILIPVAELMLVAICVAIMLWRFANKKRTPLFVYLVVGLAWFTGFSCIVAIPLDIFVQWFHGSNSIDLTIWWNCFYWGGFFLNYTVLPITKGYNDSGDFKPSGKLLYALLQQIPLIVIGLLGGGALMCYLNFTERGQTLLDTNGIGFVGVV